MKGGRAWTSLEWVPNYPLEFGAEFIHGSTTITNRLCKKAGLTIVPVDRKKVIAVTKILFYLIDANEIDTEVAHICDWIQIEDDVVGRVATRCS